MTVYVFYDPITNNNAAHCLRQQMESFITHHGDFSKMVIMHNKHIELPKFEHDDMHSGLFEWHALDVHIQHDAFLHLSKQEHQYETEEEFSWIFMQHYLVLTSKLKRYKLVTSTHRRVCNTLHVLESLLDIDTESNVNSIPVIVQHSKTTIEENTNTPSSLATFKQQLFRSDPKLVLAEHLIAAPTDTRSEGYERSTSRLSLFKRMQ